MVFLLFIISYIYIYIYFVGFCYFLGNKERVFPNPSTDQCEVALERLVGARSTDLWEKIGLDNLVIWGIEILNSFA